MAQVTFPRHVKRFLSYIVVIVALSGFLYVALIHYFLSKKCLTVENTKMSLDVLRQILKELREKNVKLYVDDYNVGDFIENLATEDEKWNITRLNYEEIEEFGSKSKHEPLIQKDSKMKYILYWNEAYGTTEYGFCCGQKPFIEAKCPRTDCFATNNRSLLNSEDFDAILFHQRSLDKLDLPAKRSPNQRYIMWMIESASYPYGFESSEWSGFFNWTMTYRQDSDFPFPYGHIGKTGEHPVEKEKLQDFIETYGEENADKYKTKDKPVAWFVSNCKAMSNRDVYVNELKKHIRVDIYGGCGNYTCDRSNEEACWQKVEKEYFFYLSFENSICVDYVTEKFFNAMKWNVVPVVLGGSDYHESAGAPFHSHINAFKDYKSPAELARYLQSLIDDPAKYAEYFWWKKFYLIDTEPASQQHPAYCEACKQLHENQEKKVYHDMEDWWTRKSKCKKYKLPRDLQHYPSQALIPSYTS